MSKLPHDIIVDILSRLPVKSLCRFKCVAKPWRTLISHPHFVKMHLTRTQKQRLLLTCMSLYSVDHKSSSDTAIEALELDYPLKSNPHIDWIQTFGSCNGLICIMPVSGIFFVFNPSTTESKKIPNFPIPCPIVSSPYEETIYGFGYAPSIDDYKFLKIAYGAFVAVYSLKTDSWKRVAEIFPYNPPHYNKPGTPLNNAIHWVFSRGKGVKYEYVIGAFDLVEERFREVPTPPNSAIDLALGVVEGCLCVLHFNEFFHNHFWVMKEYGVKESWTKMVIAIGAPDNLFKPLCLWKDSKKLLVLVDQTLLILCNLEDGMCRDVVVRNFPGGFDCDTYVESLVSPNCSNGDWVG